ncbi:MAG: ferrous iron transporter B, partial [Ruminococcus sp.]|nr:ferrous iron transporter B [Candidatus Copronaster equi]
ITSLVAGFMANESVVSTLTVLFGDPNLLLATITPVAAASLLVFCLLYTPCVAAISSIRRELGFKWAIGIVFGQCIIAWIVSLLVCGIGNLIAMV